MIYRLVRAVLRLSLRGFFRSVDIQGEDLIPAGEPVLFIANHTNAFVDPLPILTGVRRRVTVTAKSTLTGNLLLAPLIKAMGVILFHRAGDRPGGQDEAADAANARALTACVLRLRRDGAVFVFPEGVSHSDPSMREFRTGAARIAAEFLSTQSTGELWIVPVGLHFTEKDRWRSDAVALIGEPIGARRWANGRPVDVRALTAAMRDWIEALTVNFESERERELLGAAERLMGYRAEGPEPLDRSAAMDARARVALVHRLQRGAHLLDLRDPAAFERLASRTGALGRELDHLGVRAEEVGLSMHVLRVALFLLRELEVMLVGAPLALAGGALHWVPWAVTRRLVRATSTDRDHPASNAVFLSIPIFLAWWLLLDVVSFAVLPPIWALLVALAVPFTGLVSLRYRDRAGGVRRRVRTFLLWLSKPELKRRLEDGLCEWQTELRALEATLLDPPRYGREAT